MPVLCYPQTHLKAPLFLKLKLAALQLHHSAIFQIINSGQLEVAKRAFAFSDSSDCLIDAAACENGQNWLALLCFEE